MYCTPNCTNLHLIYDFVFVENNSKQNIEEGIEEVGLDFNGYRQLESNQISIELTTDEPIRLRRQAFEDFEIEPSGPIQQNGEFPPVVQRFNLKRLLEMPDDFGDIKQISLDIEFLTQPHHEHNKQFLPHDLNFVHTTTQNTHYIYSTPKPFLQKQCEENSNSGLGHNIFKITILHQKCHLILRPSCMHLMLQ